MRPTITAIDYEDINSFFHNVKSRFPREGLALFYENQNMRECVKDTIKLNNQINKKKETMIK